MSTHKVITYSYKEQAHKRGERFPYQVSAFFHLTYKDRRSIMTSEPICQLKNRITFHITQSNKKRSTLFTRLTAFLFV